MSSGLDWHESDVPYTDAAKSEIRMDASPDPGSLPFRAGAADGRAPGQIWNYNSGSTELLGAVLRKASLRLRPATSRRSVSWYRSTAPGQTVGLRLDASTTPQINGQGVFFYGTNFGSAAR
jgi:hypothetical protein